MVFSCGSSSFFFWFFIDFKNFQNSLLLFVYKYSNLFINCSSYCFFLDTSIAFYKIFGFYRIKYVYLGHLESLCKDLLMEFNCRFIVLHSLVYHVIFFDLPCFLVFFYLGYKESIWLTLLAAFIYRFVISMFLIQNLSELGRRLVGISFISLFFIYFIFRVSGLWVFRLVNSSTLKECMYLLTRNISEAKM